MITESTTADAPQKLRVFEFLNKGISAPLEQLSG